MAKAGTNHGKQSLTQGSNLPNSESVQSLSVASNNKDKEHESDVNGNLDEQAAAAHRGTEPSYTTSPSSLLENNHLSKNSSTLSPEGKQEAKESFMSLLIGQRPGDILSHKSLALSPCRVSDGYHAPKHAINRRLWATNQASYQKIIKSSEQSKKAPRVRYTGPSQLQALLEMPKEQLKNESPLLPRAGSYTKSSTISEAPTENISEKPSPHCMTEPNHLSTKQPQPRQVLSKQNNTDNGFHISKPPAILPTQSEDSSDLSAYLFSSYHSLLSSAQEQTSSNQVSSLPQDSLLDSRNTLAFAQCPPQQLQALQQQQNQPQQLGSTSSTENSCLIGSSHVHKKPRLGIDESSSHTMSWQAPSSSTSSSVSEPAQETRQRRFQRTRFALEKSGLLDVTMKTARLIHENKILEHEINQLKNDAEGLMQSVIQQEDPDVRGYVLAKCANLLIANSKSVP